ncbi:hypothetical protein WA158_001096 [Blastocystis sp. Blastoise]
MKFLDYHTDAVLYTENIDIISESTKVYDFCFTQNHIQLFMSLRDMDNQKNVSLVSVTVSFVYLNSTIYSTAVNPAETTILSIQFPILKKDTSLTSKYKSSSSSSSSFPSSSHVLLQTKNKPSLSSYYSIPFHLPSSYYIRDILFGIPNYPLKSFFYNNYLITIKNSTTLGETSLNFMHVLPMSIFYKYLDSRKNQISVSPISELNQDTIEGILILHQIPFNQKSSCISLSSLSSLSSSSSSSSFTYSSFSYSLIQYIPITPIYPSSFPNCLHEIQVNPSLPEGLYISPNGVISGIPTQSVQNHTVTITTIDNLGYTSTNILYIYIKKYTCTYPGHDYIFKIDPIISDLSITIRRQQEEHYIPLIRDTSLSTIHYCESKPSFYSIHISTFNYNRKPSSTTLSILYNDITIYNALLDPSYIQTQSFIFSSYTLLSLLEPWNIYSPKTIETNINNEYISGKTSSNNIESQKNSIPKGSRDKPNNWPIKEEYTSQIKNNYTIFDMNAYEYEEIYPTESIVYLYKSIYIPSTFDSPFFTMTINTNTYCVIYINGILFYTNHHMKYYSQLLPAFSSSSSILNTKNHNNLYIIEDNSENIFIKGQNNIISIELYPINFSKSIPDPPSKIQNNNNSNIEKHKIPFIFFINIFIYPNQHIIPRGNNYISQDIIHNSLSEFNLVSPFILNTTKQEYIQSYLYSPYIHISINSYSVYTVNVYSWILEAKINSEWVLIHSEFIHSPYKSTIDINNENIYLLLATNTIYTYPFSLLGSIESLRFHIYLRDESLPYIFYPLFYSNNYISTCIFKHDDLDYSIPNTMYIISLCPYGYKGLMLYNCTNTLMNQISEDKTHCESLHPSSLSYSSSYTNFIVNQPILPLIPIYDNIINQFIINDTLPLGLVFNQTTGIITGIPQQIINIPISYSIYGSNDNGKTNIYILSISIKGCKEEDGWPNQSTGTEASIPCSIGNSGIKTRFCNKDNQWEEVKSNCHEIYCPSIITNHIEYPKTSANTLYTSRCSGDYTGITERYCNSNGNWEDIRVSCTILTCNEQQDHGYRWPQIHSGSNYTYVCNKGYKGSISRLCEKGVWKNVINGCKKIFCNSTTDEEGHIWPEIEAEHEQLFDCPLNMMGNLKRFCNSEGIWEDIQNTCRYCLPGSMPLIIKNKVGGCKSCPPGQACPDGTKEGMIKCSGIMYSHGGEKDCIPCIHGKVELKTEGNYICRVCRSGEISYENNCYSPIMCISDGIWNKTRLGSTLYKKCPNNDEDGYMSRRCERNSLGLPVWGDVRNGCFKHEISYGYIRYEFNVVFSNLPLYFLTDNIQFEYISSFLKTFSNIAGNIKIVYLKEHITPSSISSSIHMQVVTLYTYSNTFTQILSSWSSLLRQSLQQRHPSIFHPYVNITISNLYISNKNLGICKKNGIWPETQGNTTIHIPCGDSFSFGEIERTCIYKNGKTYWGSINKTQCYPQEHYSHYYYYNITYPSISILSLLFNCPYGYTPLQANNFFNSSSSSSTLHDYYKSLISPLYIKTVQEYNKGMKSCISHNITISSTFKSFLFFSNIHKTESIPVLTVQIISPLTPHKLYSIVSMYQKPLFIKYKYYNGYILSNTMKMTQTSSKIWIKRTNTIHNIQFNPKKSIYTHITTSTYQDYKLFQTIYSLHSYSFFDYVSIFLWILLFVSIPLFFFYFFIHYQLIRCTNNLF